MSQHNRCDTFSKSPRGSLEYTLADYFVLLLRPSYLNAYRVMSEEYDGC